MAVLKYKSNTGEWITIEPGLNEQAVQSLINSSLPTYTDTEGATAAVGGFAVGDTADGMTFQEFAYKLLHPVVEPTPIIAPECYINLVPTFDTSDPEKIVSVGFDNQSWIRKTNATATTPGADLTDVKVYINDTLVDTLTSEELYEANNNPVGFSFNSKTYTITETTSDVTVKIDANGIEFTDRTFTTGIQPLVQIIPSLYPDANRTETISDSETVYYFTEGTSVNVLLPVRLKRGTKNILSIGLGTGEPIAGVNYPITEILSANELTDINSSSKNLITTYQDWFNYNLTGTHTITVTQDTTFQVHVKYQGISDSEPLDTIHCITIKFE